MESTLSVFKVSENYIRPLHKDFDFLKIRRGPANWVHQRQKVDDTVLERN